MKDNVAKGISTAKQTGQLRKDAAVQGRRSSIGKRDSGGGLSSSSSLISGSTSSTTRSSSSISGINSRNSTRRMQNGKNIDKAIKIAERIPVARKYAKMAKMIERIKSTRNKGFFQNLMSKVGDKANASADDVEEANRAEQLGEEYKPDAAEARYTAITTRQMKYLFIFICGGILVGAIFFCVIMVSSLADSGGKAYLASKSNPIEEELTEWYSNQSGDDANSSNNNSEGSNYYGESTSSSTPPVPVPKTGNQTIDKINEIATKEAENGVGRRKYQDWYGLEADWCGMFVSWLFDQVNGLDKYYEKSGAAGPGARGAVANGYGTWYEDECTDSKTVPKSGDVLHWNTCKPGDDCYLDRYSSRHVGYVYAVDDKNIYTVEGNHDPERVVFVTHERKDCMINGYYRPNY